MSNPASLFPSTVTTADAVARGPTVLAHALALTVAAHHHGDTSLHHSSPTSSQRQVTTATATPSPVAVTATVEAEGLATKGSARDLGPGHALWSKERGSETGRGNGREIETAAPLTCRPPRNTNTSEEEVTTAATGGTGRDLAPTTGRETGSAATRANIIAAAGTQDTVATGVETHTDRLSGSGSHFKIDTVGFLGFSNAA